VADLVAAARGGAGVRFAVVEAGTRGALGALLCDVPALERAIAHGPGVARDVSAWPVESEAIEIARAAGVEVGLSLVAHSDGTQTVLRMAVAAPANGWSRDLDLRLFQHGDHVASAPASPRPRSSWRCSARSTDAPAGVDRARRRNRSGAAAPVQSNERISSPGDQGTRPQHRVAEREAAEAGVDVLRDDLRGSCRRGGHKCASSLRRDAGKARLAFALVGHEHDGGSHRPDDRARVAADLLAVALQELGLVAEHVHPEREPVGVVGVARDEAKGALLSPAADEDARPADLDRARPVERCVDPVEAPSNVGRSSVNIRRQIVSASSRRSIRSPTRGKSKP